MQELILGARSQSLEFWAMIQVTSRAQGFQTIALSKLISSSYQSERLETANGLPDQIWTLGLRDACAMRTARQWIPLDGRFRTSSFAARLPAFHSRSWEVSCYHWSIGALRLITHRLSPPTYFGRARRPTT